jgi:uncharacterized membrane protein
MKVHVVYQLLAHGPWFSPDTPASSTTETGRHDIAEILVKVALNNNPSLTHYIYHQNIIITTILLNLSSSHKSWGP